VAPRFLGNLYNPYAKYLIRCRLILKQIVKKILCVYENRSSVPEFRQTLNLRAHLASLTSRLILHYLTVYIPGVRMIHNGNEVFISKNLFTIRTSGLHHYKGNSLFFVMSPTLVAIGVDFPGGTKINPGDIILLSPCC
jgi:hypothetical protein